MEKKDNQYKDALFFIAYKGQEIDHNTIINVLKEIDTIGHGTVWTDGLNTLFVKRYKYLVDNEFYFNKENKILTVSAYNRKEFQKIVNNYSKYNINDFRRISRIINFLYDEYKEKMFKILGDNAHFCSVIWDDKNKDFVAGVTKPNSRYTHLYYGYTEKNHEIMYSNNRKILSQFCNEIGQIPKNTYMKNGELYTIDGQKYNANKTFDKKGLILNFTAEETKRQISQIIKNTVEEFGLESKITEKLNAVLDEKLENYVNQVQIPKVNIIKMNDTILGQTKGGFYHEKFEQILTQVQLDEPIMLIGPAGSGKNVAIQQVADALGKHMYYTNNASNEFKLTGFIDAGGNYRDTEFYKAFKNGGIFFLDEIDNSDPSALIVINSALANGYMAFPHETIDRHSDFRIIAAANTWGKGADLQYVGRNALDGATLDRFDNIFFDYDTNLEKALYPNDEVLQFMWAFRNAVYKSKIPHIVSTRGIGKVYKKEINGIPVNDTLTSNVIKNLGQDDVNTIIGNMQNISSDNKYYDGIMRLRLRR